MPRQPSHRSMFQASAVFKALSLPYPLRRPMQLVSFLRYELIGGLCVSLQALQRCVPRGTKHKISVSQTPSPAHHSHAGQLSIHRIKGLLSGTCLRSDFSCCWTL